MALFSADKSKGLTAKEIRDQHDQNLTQGTSVKGKAQEVQNSVYVTASSSLQGEPSDDPDVQDAAEQVVINLRQFIKQLKSLCVPSLDAEGVVNTSGWFQMFVRNSLSWQSEIVLHAFSQLYTMNNRREASEALTRLQLETLESLNPLIVANTDRMISRKPDLEESLLQYRE